MYKRSFRGYKVRPTYLERLQNHLNGIKAAQKAKEDLAAQQSSSTLSQNLDIDVSVPHHQQQAQPSEIQQSGARKVTASDLRNKRSNIQNSNYQPRTTTYGRARPTYAIRPSYQTGAFQTDGL
jgi:hypothetical protein